MVYLWLVLGLALLAFGGDTLVSGAVCLARRLKVSPLLIGLTLVGFGTSTPELVTSLIAAVKGSDGIAVGNVVGSNIANILLVLGAAAVIRPGWVGNQEVWGGGGFLGVLALGLVMGGGIWWFWFFVGGVFNGFFFFFFWVGCVLDEKKKKY